MNMMNPGTIVYPSVAYARFMLQHGYLTPYNGVVLSADERFVRVVWNNADGHAMLLRRDSLEATDQRLSDAELKALVEEANGKEVQ